MTRTKSVNYTQGFWLDLFKKWYKKRNHTLTIKIRWVWVLFFVMTLWPHPHKIIYADPITQIPAKIPPKAVALPDTSLQSQSGLDPIPVPEPAPPPQPAYVAPVSSGCVSYFSGDYYLDNIIRYESGGNSCATNPGDCFGLLQACPGAPLRAACGGSPSCQIAWFQQYKTGGRSWAQVWQHELDYGWW